MLPVGFDVVGLSIVFAIQFSISPAGSAYALINSVTLPPSHGSHSAEGLVVYIQNQGPLYYSSATTILHPNFPSNPTTTTTTTES